MKLIAFVSGLALSSVICVAGIIDATSLETLSRSLKEARLSESEEDIAIVDQFICEATDGLNPTDPKELEVVLERLRPRLHKKSVGAVALEVRMQREAARDQRNRRTKEFVRERRELWKGRRPHVHAIVIGVKRDDVLRFLGEPDIKSDSVTNENWLYRYDLAHNDEQVWFDALVVQITDGTVTNVSHVPERRHIEALMPVEGQN